MDRSTTPSGCAAARARAPASASQGKSGSCRERASWALVRGRPSVLVALRRQRRDQRVVLADLAGLRRAARTAEVGEELDVGVVEVLPLVRDVVLVVDGLHRADRLAGAAVHALVGVDVEHPVALVDAVHRTLVDARLVEDVDAGLGDDVGHGESLPGNARATTLAGPGPIVRGQYDGRLPAQREGSRCGAGGSPPEGGGRRGELHAAALPADGSDVSDAPVRRVRTSPEAMSASRYDACAALDEQLARLRSALGATRVAVWVHEASTDTVVPFTRAECASAVPVEDPRVKAPLDLARTAFLSAAVHGRRGVAARDDEDGPIGAELRSMGIRSVHAEPLVIDGEVTGVLVIDPAAAASPTLVRQTAPRIAVTLQAAAT